MDIFTSKRTGWMLLLTGIMGLLTVLTLILFFVGLSQEIRSLSGMGRINDAMNSLTSILSAVLAAWLYPSMRKFAPRSSLWLLIAVWLGALAVSYGSWLIITGRGDLELSSYYYFVGNGLIGVWLWMLSRIVRNQAQEAWPRNLARLGLVAGSFMMIGLLGLYGIILGLDSSEFKPLLMITGFSFVGIGVLYPVWCIRLAIWILSRQ